MTDITFADVLALVWFMGCWIGFDAVSRRRTTHTHSLVSALRIHRRRWVATMPHRENNQVDAQILNNLLRFALFFATTTIFILAGLVALLGTTQKVVETVSALPFAAPLSLWMWEVKVLLLVAIFVYAFFKFTWSSWQYNALSILVGQAATQRGSAEREERFVECASRVAAYAGYNFNHGMRAYYLSMAAMSWFLHPWLMIAATTLIVLVLYRREFRSNTLEAFVAGLEPGELGAAPGTETVSH
ncbi:MAG TPA: DUF599 domain-containing protein [Casimicrobiaceae bacterium]|nr:DUF599 domain-containing protein [Casimicrobiaceae bacterium]